MKKQRYIVFLFFILFAFQINAQSDLYPCGNDNYYSPWLRSYLASETAATNRSGAIRYIPVKIHLVAEDSGSGRMSLTTLYRSFCTLNEDFADAEIQFFIDGEINYINNSDYFNHDFGTGFSMMNNNNVPDAINCYIVDSPAGNCGYFSPGADGVALAKGCTQPSDHTWAHEVGHFLSLPHTFFGWSSVDELNFEVPAPQFVGGIRVENADGSNCSFSADGFCDTPADYLNYRWSCNNEGLSSVVQIDPTGEAFTSEGSFIMSYSNDACANRFSEEQMGAMRANLEQERTNLLTAPPSGSVEIPLTESVTVVSPVEGTLVDGTGSVRIEWEPIPNTEKYILQVNPFPFFSLVFNEYVVDEPFAEFSNLIADETFYWRVRPYSSYYTCHGFTDAHSFDTGSNIVSTFELNEGEDLKIFPNPVKEDYFWMEITSLSSKEAQWEIRGVGGRLIQTGNQKVLSGEQQILVNTAGFSSGMYVLGLQLGDKKVFRKFIITK